MTLETADRAAKRFFKKITIAFSNVVVPPVDFQNPSMRGNTVASWLRVNRKNGIWAI